MRGLALIFALLPSAGFALSCMPWGISNAFIQAEAADDAYVPALGTLRFNEKELPLAKLKSQSDLPKGATLSAKFEGHALVRGAKDVPFSTPVALNVSCASHWCGSAQSGPVLALLRKENGHYIADQGPCGGNVFFNPDADQIQLMRDCVDGKRCKAVMPFQ